MDFTIGKEDPQFLRQYIQDNIGPVNLRDYFLDDMFDDAIIMLAENDSVGWFVIYDYNHIGAIIENKGHDISWLNDIHSNAPKNVLFWEEIN